MRWDKFAAPLDVVLVIPIHCSDSCCSIKVGNVLPTANSPFVLRTTIYIWPKNSFVLSPQLVMDALAHLLKEAYFQIRLSMEMLGFLKYPIPNRSISTNTCLNTLLCQSHTYSAKDLAINDGFWTCAMLRRHKKLIICWVPVQSTLFCFWQCYERGDDKLYYSQTKEILECGSNWDLYFYLNAIAPKTATSAAQAAEGSLRIQAACIRNYSCCYSVGNFHWFPFSSMYGRMHTEKNLLYLSLKNFRVWGHYSLLYLIPTF